MKIKANVVVLSVNYKNGKNYILSESDNDISIPCVFVDNNNKVTLENDIKKLIMEYLPKINELELIQQIITHHSPLLDTSEDEINMVFAYLITFTPSLENAFWIELDWRKPHRLHEVLFQVAQRLK